MALTSRISLTGPPEEEPEDFLATSLGVIYPDDVTNQHGDAEHGLLYTSPRLPKPLQISLADVTGDEDRRLFGHYLWNASLLLAEFIEGGTLGLEILDSDPPVLKSLSGSQNAPERLYPPLSTFNVMSKHVLELGAGTALPSLLSSLLGASEVQVTDYPAPDIISNLKKVVKTNAIAINSPLGIVSPIFVTGHEWGDLSTPFALENQAKYDRVFVCDCLWMPWQHGNLRQSIAWCLKGGEESRVWVIAGMHTGRSKMRTFFDESELRGVGLEVERIWERDCDGRERAWVWDRGIEDVSERKRWLVVAILRRVKATP
jgi:predicted nicotinamide N-methyase